MDAIKRIYDIAEACLDNMPDRREFVMDCMEYACDGTEPDWSRLVYYQKAMYMLAFDLIDLRNEKRDED